MQVVINGEAIDITEGTSVEQLMSSYGIEKAGVAVELNLNILENDELDTTVLASGDRLEIISFVGGG